MSGRLSLALAFATAAAGCALGWSQEPPCRRVAEAAPLPGRIGESSGIAISRSHRGIYWTHNDSGGEPRLYAVDAGGGIVAEVAVRGAVARDWEDLSLASCDGGDCLYVADIGDNEEVRRTATIYRVPEPDPGGDTEAAAEAFRVRYPDRPRDAEAVFVLPGEGIHLVTKGRTDPPAIFRYPPPLRAGETVTLERVQALAEGEGGVPIPRQVTGADASPDGRHVAVRTYTSLQLYRVEGGRFTPLYGTGGTDLRALREPQGEAVALGEGGEVLLASEAGIGYGPGGIWRLRCRIPER